MNSKVIQALLIASIGLWSLIRSETSSYLDESTTETESFDGASSDYHMFDGDFVSESSLEFSVDADW